MKITWKTRRLYELCEWFGDGDWIESKDQSTDGIRLIQTGNIGSGFFKDRAEKARYVSEDTFIRLKCTEIFQGDCLISRLPDPVGRSCILPDIKERMITAVDCTIARFKQDEIIPDFFNYFSQSSDYIENIGLEITGTTRSRISRKKLGQIDIPVPPLPEQLRIVAILDEAFAGIAAAKKNAEQNLKNAKEVFASAINSIEGKKVNLGDYVEIKTGKLDANAAEENGKYPFFTCSREIFSINNFSFDCEAILLAGNNAVGDFNVKYFNGKFNAYQRTYVITANKRRQILCKYLYIQLLNSLKKFKEKSVGAATKFLKLGMIKEMQIILPSLLEQETIISNLSCIQERTEKLESIYQQKLSNLEELKKSLLQQAFSGAL